MKNSFGVISLNHPPLRHLLLHFSRRPQPPRLFLRYLSCLLQSAQSLCPSQPLCGVVSIFDADPFVLLKSVKAHKKGVNDLAVHPSGKLALSVGGDKCLPTVNLRRKLGIHQAEDAKLLCELKGNKRFLCAAPGDNGVILTGGEDRSIIAWDTNSGKVAYCIGDAHSAHVKGVVVLNKNDGGGGADDPYLVASAS